jgi:UDP-glucose 4-epimerase
MKILVTGGLGYIGLNTCYELLKRDYEVVIIDNLSNSSIDNLNLLKGSITFYPIDIRDSKELKNVFQNHKIDIVIHFASLKSVPESMKQSLLYYDNNICGTIQLLKVMKEYKCYKIIFSSSACVYSKTKTSEDEEIHMDKITNPYGHTKAMMEQILKYDKDFECIILRYFNPIGTLVPNISISKNVSNLMDVILDSIANQKKFYIFGNDYETKDGTCIRDFIHIYDLVMGHIQALEYFGKNELKYSIFNLGCGNGVSVKELVETFEKVNKVKLNYEIYSRREGDIPISLASIGKALKLLGWKPIKTLEEMCIDSYSIIKND